MDIHRYYSPFGTLGFCPDVNLWAIERPWANNVPKISCIPEGEYRLERHSPTNVTLPEGFDYTYALVNEDLNVSHYPKDYCNRNLCLFHIANYSHQVEGCIGWGTGVSIHENKLMVTNSNFAVRTILEHIRDNQIDRVRITQYRVKHYQTS